MVKNILRIAIATTFLVGNSSQTHADILLAWNTFGNLGTETTEPSVSNDLNIATANLSLGAGVNGSANVNRFGGNNWLGSFNYWTEFRNAPVIIGRIHIRPWICHWHTIFSPAYNREYIKHLRNSQHRNANYIPPVWIRRY